MVKGFWAQMRIVQDHRIPRTVTYPLNEILLTRLVRSLQSPAHRPRGKSPNIRAGQETIASFGFDRGL